MGEFARGASSSLRKSKNQVAAAIGKAPKTTRSPRADFDDIVSKIPAAFRKEALKWYRIGIKRGMKKATDLMAEGTIYEEDGSIIAPRTIKFKVNTSIQGVVGSHDISIPATDIGFT